MKCDEKNQHCSDANGNAGTELSGRFIKLGGQYQFTTAVDRAPNEGMTLTHTLKLCGTTFITMVHATDFGVLTIRGLDTPGRRHSQDTGFHALDLRYGLLALIWTGHVFEQASCVIQCESVVVLWYFPHSF